MARTGRPKLEDSRSHKISVRFSDEQLARLEAYCEKFQLNKAQVLMKGFENWNVRQKRIRANRQAVSHWKVR